MIGQFTLGVDTARRARASVRRTIPGLGAGGGNSATAADTAAGTRPVRPDRAALAFAGPPTDADDLGVIPSELAQPAPDLSLERLVLGAEDLLADDFVEHDLDPTAGPLVRHLDSCVPRFRPDAGAVVAFVAIDDVDGQTSVESGVFPAGRRERPLVAAIDAWVRREHAGSNTRTWRDDGTAEWVSTDGSFVEALRYDRLPGGVLAITTTSGDRRAEPGPEVALDYYAGLVRRRADRHTARMDAR